MQFRAMGLHEITWKVGTDSELSPRALSCLRDLEDEEEPVEESEKWPHEDKVTKFTLQFTQPVVFKS